MPYKDPQQRAFFFRYKPWRLHYMKQIVVHGMKSPEPSPSQKSKWSYQKPQSSNAPLLPVPPPSAQLHPGKYATKAVLLSKDRAYCTQAERIFRIFGGVKDLSRALDRIGRPRNVASLYKWAYPIPKGRGGLIPTSALHDIMSAARSLGLILTPIDLAALPSELDNAKEKRAAVRKQKRHQARGKRR